MKIDDATWDAIIAETKAAIERLNACARKAGTKGKFAVNAPTAGPGTKYAFLITESRGCGTQRKAVARELATGELRQTKIVKQGVNISSNDPKAWAKLADKPIAELVRGLNLTNYWIISVKPIETTIRTIAPAARRDASTAISNSRRRR